MIRKLISYFIQILRIGKGQKSWKDIKLHQAQELLQLDKEGIDLLVSQMAIVLDTDEAFVENLPFKKIQEFAEEYEFLQKTPDAKWIKTFKIEGKRFGMVPLNDLTLAQIIDIEEYWNDGYIKNLHKILSVLFLPVKSYNPITKKYKLQEYKPDEDIENLLLNTDMEIIWSNLLFFYHTEQIYLKGMKDYLEAELKKRK